MEMTSNFWNTVGLGGMGGQDRQQPLLPGESGSSPEERALELCLEGRTGV